MRLVVIPSAVFCTAIICHVAVAGESPQLSGGGDLLTLFCKTLMEYGILGVILGYMLVKEHRRDKRDHEQQQEKERNNQSKARRQEEQEREVARRFSELDNKLIALVEKNITVMSELQATIKDHTTEVRSLHILVNNLFMCHPTIRHTEGKH